MTPSPAEIHERIEELDRLLEELVEELRDAGNTAGIAEAVYKREFALARLRARATPRDDGKKVTDPHADDLATAETYEANLAHLTTKHNLTVLREVSQARRAQLDALRTLSAAQRGAGG